MIFFTGWFLNPVNLPLIIHNIRLPKQSTVGDALNEIKTKVTSSHLNDLNAELRPIAVLSYKIYKFLVE
ncbi:putative ubiquitinyl hydrolase 1 [Helianthus anomalus]